MILVYLRQLKNHAQAGILLALGVILIITVFFALRTWYEDWKIITQPQPAASTNSLSTAATSQLITAIPETHIFGQTYSESSNTPLTNLQIQVTGIVKIENENNQSISKAYLSIEGQPSKIFQTGDRLPNGVKVYAIKEDAVILENGGQLEKLLLARKPLQFKSRPAKELE